jgi:hypothetical protein
VLAIDCKHVGASRPVPESLQEFEYNSTGTEEHVINIASGQYAGYDCLKISNHRLVLWVTKSLGPRVIGLSVQGSENLFAVLPESKYTHPDGREFHFRGGHRLWTAPEAPEITYVPDNLPLEIEELADGIRVVQPVDEVNRIQKTMTIVVGADEAEIQVTHQVYNTGEQPLELAAWAITQLRPGGVAILPMETEMTDAHWLQPNRQLVLWPYSDIGSEHISLGNRYVQVRAEFKRGAFKVGYPNPKGWLAYYNQGNLFVKQAAFDPGESYVDFGASSQCYCNPDFLELETLSPLTRLQPEESLSHVEIWKVLKHAGLPHAKEFSEADIDELLKGIIDLSGH